LRSHSAAEANPGLVRISWRNCCPAGMAEDAWR
jgi:hypothetical protein